MQGDTISMKAKRVSREPAAPSLDVKAVRIAVVIPTFKRPEHLALTLASVTAQRTRRDFAAIVVENHVEGSEGFRVAEAMFAGGQARGFVVAEPRHGNCNAYNAGFAKALATFPNLTHVAIIDDDEIATPEWLEHLAAASEASQAEIIGGPHSPVFEDAEAGQRFGAHPVFRPAHAASGSTTMITSTGNCLISVKVLKAMGPPWLDERYNFLGGGDSDFFTRCREKGFRFHWAAEALVHETVPARRTDRRWITARSVRNGLISAQIQHRQHPGIAGRLGVVAKSLALLAASPFRLPGLWWKTGSFYIGSYHMMVAAGRLLAEFGYTIEQYRQPEKN
jgi:GT2 family glycosyltransferase